MKGGPHNGSQRQKCSRLILAFKELWGQCYRPVGPWTSENQGVGNMKTEMQPRACRQATHGPHLDTKFSCHQKVTFLLFKSSLTPIYTSLLGLMYKTQGLLLAGGWGAHSVWQADASVAICTGHSEAAVQTCGHVRRCCVCWGMQWPSREPSQWA